MTRLVDAAGDHDTRAMWRLLSRGSRARLGLSFAEFSSGAARGLERTVGSFAHGYELILAEQITTSFAVAAVAGERGIRGKREYTAYAAALRLEQGRWYVELRGRVRLQAIRPHPDERVRARTQLAAEVAAAAPIEEAGIWLDGRAFPSRGGGTDDRHLTMFGEAPPLTNGRHTVVAFASSKDSAAALAWTFSVRGSRRSA